MIRSAHLRTALRSSVPRFRRDSAHHRLLSCSTRLSSSSSPPAPAAPYDMLFCGTDHFASVSLSTLLSRSHLFSSLHVLTPPDNAPSWGGTRMKSSPVKRIALQHGLPHSVVPPSGMVGYTPPSDLVNNGRAILLTCSFGHLIPDALLDVFEHPWQRLNIHPSLLPELRGAAPIQWALARRMKKSGVSVQTLERGRFDTGKVVQQVSFDFPPPEVAGKGFLQVERLVAERAAELLVRTLEDLPRSWAESWEQDEARKTYAPKLKAENSVVRWARWSAGDVVARERGFAYLYPLSTTLLPPPDSPSTFRPVTVNLSNTSALPLEQLRSQDPASASPLANASAANGSAIYSPQLDALVVKCQGPHVLTVGTLKVAGKKLKSAADWYAAYKDRAGRKSGLLRFA